LSEPATQEFREARPLDGLPIASAIEGIATNNTRNFGGEIASRLMAGAMQQIANDTNGLKMENCRLIERNDSLMEDFGKMQVQHAILAEKIRSEGRNKHLRNLSITVGTSLIGIGITLSRTNLDAYSIGAIIFGGSLLLLGWFSGPREEKI